MTITRKFISAPYGMSDYGHTVPAPLLRRCFTADGAVQSAVLTVTGLGYYRIFVNGHELTRSHLSPYTSNLDHIVYFDRYDIGEYLVRGENVIGIVLGNGLRNSVGGRSWGFNEARFRGAPQAGLVCSITCGGETHTFEADSNFRCHTSPILFDDLRLGEIYDARLEDEVRGWLLPGFDDSLWDAAVMSDMPRGEQRICKSPPIVPRGELPPVKIWREENAYIYDFGQNGAGLITLHTSAESGRRIVVDFAEYLMNGKFYNETIRVVDPVECRLPYGWQTVEYTCRGGESEYTPSFTYFGFRYARVRGITEAEAVPELLTYTLMSTRMRTRGGFTSDDPTARALQRMTREATLSNMLHIPTDCPHREKNGWTADAAMSAVHILLNLEADEMLTEWMRSVALSLNSEGAMPGLVPATADISYDAWNGPGWDAVLTELPYRLWELRSDIRAARIASGAMIRYVAYTLGRRDPDGLVGIGLGDWCAPHEPIKSPLRFTDTVMCYDISRKAAMLYRAMDMEPQSKFCRDAADGYLTALREHMINHDRCIAAGDCQTSQAMAIYYGIFTDDEVPRAVDALLRQISEANDHIDCGVLGARVLFRVLTEHGQVDTAWRVLTQPTAPSYGEWVARGETTLVEDFNGPDQRINSRNHHFLGDISAWFIDSICGIRVNPGLKQALDRGDSAVYRVIPDGACEVDIAPHLPECLNTAEAYHETQGGTVKVRLWREMFGDLRSIRMEVTVDGDLRGRVFPPAGYTFDGCGSYPLREGCEVYDSFLR